MMRCLAFVGLAAAVAVGCSAQGASSTEPSLAIACAGVGFPALRVEVRRADGRPIAAGGTLLVIDGHFWQTVVETWDPLALEAADNRAGTYAIEVNKPFYKTVRLDHIVVPGGPCGATRTVTVPVTLEALPNAPAIRSVSVAEPGVGLGVGLHNQYHVWVDALPGTDTSVTWSLSDPRVATIDQKGFLTAKCATKDDISVIAASVASASIRGTGRLGVTGSACP